MEEKIITNIISIKYVEKINKYLVEIGILNEPKMKVWLTDKQMINLKNNFDMTRKSYSNKNEIVTAVFNEKGYYAYSKFYKVKQKRLFKVPKEMDLSDLIDD